MLLYEFQKSIYQALKSAVTVNVYDYVPEKTKLPYIIIGDDKAEEYNTKLEKGWEITTTIHVWGGEKSMKSVKTQLSTIENALATDIDIYEFHKVVSVEAQRVDVDLVKGTIVVKYRMED